MAGPGFAVTRAVVFLAAARRVEHNAQQLQDHQLRYDLPLTEGRSHGNGLGKTLA